MKEELTNLINEGKVHPFKNNEVNYLYVREENLTFESTDNVFKILTEEKFESVEEGKELTKLFNELRNLKYERPVRERIHLDAIPEISVLNNLVDELGSGKNNLEVFIDFSHFNEGDERVAGLIEFIKKTPFKIRWVFCIQIHALPTDEFINSIKDLGISISLAGEPKDYGNFFIKNPRARGVFTLQLNESSDLFYQKYINSRYRFLISLKEEDQKGKDIFLEGMIYKLNRMVEHDDKINALEYVTRIMEYCIRRPYFKTDITEYSQADGVMQKKERSSACSSCWAKDICWQTHCYRIFNSTPSKTSKNVSSCNYIRTIIEETIGTIKKIKNKKLVSQNKVITFEKFKIKLINA